MRTQAFAILLTSQEFCRRYELLPFHSLFLLRSYKPSILCQRR